MTHRPIGRMIEVVLSLAAGILADASASEGESIFNSIGTELRAIAVGEFLMGAADDDGDAQDDERPRHRVRITRDFYLGVYEVTQAEFWTVMGTSEAWFSDNGPGRKTAGGRDTSRWPYDMASWNDAVEFCRKLTELPAEKKAGRSYRLPTEAEWEYACRAGTTTRFNLGDTLLPGDAQASLNGPSATAKHLGHPLAVGSCRPNAWGLYDMHGNVWEWCSDWYSHDYYDRSPPDDPQGPALGTGHVVRGGDWHFDAPFCRSANRDFTRTTRRNLGTGFRVACDVRRPLPSDEAPER
jgi:formylglycine-generating enzyme required for sulfatase activity